MFHDSCIQEIILANTTHCFIGSDNALVLLETIDKVKPARLVLFVIRACHCIAHHCLDHDAKQTKLYVGTRM